MLLGSNPTLIDVHPSQPIRTLKELIDDAEAHPGKFSYGTSGVGTMNHLIGELFKSLTQNADSHMSPIAARDRRCRTSSVGIFRCWCKA